MSVETKYERLAEVIRKRIASGTYMDELPSEADLTNEFGYSRSTVRAAFTSLENEGLITARSGTRRTITRQHRWSWPMSTWERGHTIEADAWAMTVREQGGTPATEVAVQIEEADERIALALDIQPGERVILRRRIRTVNGEPHQLADSYFPSWLTDKHPIFLKPGDISAAGGLLASVGLPQVRFVDEITARMPQPPEARSLRTARGVPLIVHNRIGFDEQGRPVRFMVTRMTADRARVEYSVP